MSDFYNEIDADVIEAIREVGEGGEIELQIWIDGVAADPTKPLDIAGPTIGTRYYTLAPSIGYNADRVEGENKYIAQGDRQFIIAAGDIRTGPELTDPVADVRVDQGMIIWRKEQNDSWEIISVETVEPTDTKLVFVCQGRKWPMRTM